MKTRTLQTKIWVDDWFSSLSAIEKLGFIYFLTNSHVNLCGIYELTDRVIMFELGLTHPQLNSLKDKLSSKIIFHGGYVAIKNVSRYDDYKGGQLVKAKENQLKEIPSNILEEINNTLSMGHEGVSSTHGYSNSNSNSNNNKGVIGGKEKTLSKKPEYLTNIPLEDYEYLKKETSATDSQVKRKGEELHNWMVSKNKAKSYSDFKATLRNAVLKDFPKFPIQSLSIRH
jgi:predicted transcriptional regulator YdeE